MKNIDATHSNYSYFLMFSCSFLQHHFVENYFDNYLMYICDKESEEHTMYKQAGKGYFISKTYNRV